MDFKEGDITFDCHNFGRKLYLGEEQESLRNMGASHDEIENVVRETESDHVCFVFCNVPEWRTYRIIINEYSKKRLKRVVRLERTEDEYDMLAEVTEFKY